MKAARSPSRGHTAGRWSESVASGADKTLPQGALEHLSRSPPLSPRLPALRGIVPGSPAGVAPT